MAGTVSSVVDPKEIFLSDSNPQIRNTGLRIWVRIQKAY